MSGPARLPGARRVFQRVEGEIRVAPLHEVRETQRRRASRRQGQQRQRIGPTTRAGLASRVSLSRRIKHAPDEAHHRAAGNAHGPASVRALRLTLGVPSRARRHMFPDARVRSESLLPEGTEAWLLAMIGGAPPFCEDHLDRRISRNAENGGSHGAMRPLPTEEEIGIDAGDPGGVGAAYARYRIEPCVGQT